MMHCYSAELQVIDFIVLHLKQVSHMCMCVSVCVHGNVTWCIREKVRAANYKLTEANR